MKKITKFCITFVLLLISVQVFAESIVICKNNYNLDTAVQELNAAIGNYPASAPSDVIGYDGHHTICVTVTKPS